eukprot:3568878-Amphidinium_carterae.2
MGSSDDLDINAFKWFAGCSSALHPTQLIWAHAHSISRATPKPPWCSRPEYSSGTAINWQQTKVDGAM